MSELTEAPLEEAGDEEKEDMAPAERSWLDRHQGFVSLGGLAVVLVSIWATDIRSSAALEHVVSSNTEAIRQERTAREKADGEIKVVLTKLADKFERLTVAVVELTATMRAQQAPSNPGAYHRGTYLNTDREGQIGAERRRALGFSE